MLCVAPPSFSRDRKIKMKKITPHKDIPVTSITFWFFPFLPLLFTVFSASTASA